MIDVCLPLLPFARLEAPSIALGILKRSLLDSGLTCRVLYTNLDFAGSVGVSNYQAIAVENISLLGEWVFSRSLFDDKAPRHEDYFQYLRRLPQCLIEADHELLHLQEAACLFIDQLAKKVVAMKPRILSCTSTFQQHCAALALARRVKYLDASIVTIMGGANCEGLMGYTTRRLFPFVDYVFSGEGDFVFSDVCRTLCSQPSKQYATTQISTIQGLFDASAKHCAAYQRTTVADLNKVPIPDYDDYFEQLKEHPIAPMIRAALPVEASRGCWWGQKQHCTFCGLNGDGMPYRFKHPDRLEDELNQLTSRYGNYPFGFVDNILPTSYFDTIFSEADTSSSKPHSNYFFEVKANLSKQQVRQLASGGVTWIQPGLESLHDDALKLMKKGTTSLLNLQLLRWCLEYGIRVSWSVLTEFPGEQVQWLNEIADLMPILCHFQPPSALIPIQYHRFSPYFRDSTKYGLKLQPAEAYRHIYPFELSDLNDLVYNFEDRKSAAQPGYGYFHSPEALALYRVIQQWQQQFWAPLRPLLCMQELKNGDLQIIDTRPCAKARITNFRGLEKAILLVCDSVTPIRQLPRLVGEHGIDADHSEVQRACENLEDRKMILRIDNKLLVLAVNGELPALPGDLEYPGGSVDLAVEPNNSMASQTIKLRFRGKV